MNVIVQALASRIPTGPCPGFIAGRCWSNLKAKLHRSLQQWQNFVDSSRICVQSLYGFEDHEDWEHGATLSEIAEQDVQVPDPLDGFLRDLCHLWAVEFHVCNWHLRNISRSQQVDHGHPLAAIKTRLQSPIRSIPKWIKTEHWKWWWVVISLSWLPSKPTLGA